MDLNGTSTEHTIALFIDRAIRKDGNDIELIHRKFDEEINIPYDYIAKVIYESDDKSSNESKIEQLDNNISFILESYEGANKDTLENNLEKIANNYRLSLAQKDFIVKTTRSVEKRVSDLDQKLQNLEQSTKKAEDNLDKIEDAKSSIYTDFIAILGVFSSFVFLMFGGVDVLKSVFDVADDLETVSLQRLVIIGSMMIITLLTLMYSLLLWVSRITNKDFGQKCFHKDCQGSCQHKIKHAFYRHSFFFGLLFLFIIIIRIAQLYM